MIANLDADHLRAYLAAHGGRTTIRIGRDASELETGAQRRRSRASPRRGRPRSATTSSPTSRRPAGRSSPRRCRTPTTRASRSSTARRWRRRTSRAPPRSCSSCIRRWTPAQVKSALVSTAGAAWADTARTHGGARARSRAAASSALPSAADPQLFTEPVSLSFEDLDVRHGARRSGRCSSASPTRAAAPARGRSSSSPQAATAGTSVDVPASSRCRPAAKRSLPVVARAAAPTAVQGEDYGFVVLQKGARDAPDPVPLPRRPARARRRAVCRCGRQQAARRERATSRVSAYRYPVAPFGNAPDCAADGRGRRRDRSTPTLVDEPAVNAGVSVLQTSERRAIDPFFLGARDESTVQGFAGTPVDVNALTYDYLLPSAPPAPSFPRAGALLRRVDSGRDPFTGPEPRRPLRAPLVGERRDAAVAPAADDAGRGGPPDARASALLDTAVRRRPVVARRSATRARSSRVGSYDPITGIAVVPAAERRARACAPARPRTCMFVSSDFQEAKNIDTIGAKSSCRTRARSAPGMRVVAGVATELAAALRRRCVSEGRRRCVAAAGAPDGVERCASCSTAAGSRQAAATSRALWTRGRSAKLSQGRHVLSAVAVTRPRTAASPLARDVRTCRTQCGRRVAVVTGASSGIGAEIARAACGPRLASASCSHAARTACGRSPTRSAASSSSATSPTAPRSRPSRPACSSVTRGSRCSSTTPASRGGRASSTATRTVIEHVMRTNYLGERLVPARVPPGARGRRPVRRREHRLGRRHRRRAAVAARTPPRSTRSSRSRAPSRPSCARGGSACTPSSRASSRPRDSRRPGCRGRCSGSWSGPRTSRRTCSVRSSDGRGETTVPRYYGPLGGLQVVMPNVFTRVFSRGAHVLSRPPKAE